MKLIYLKNKDLFTLIDDCDFELVSNYSWYCQLRKLPNTNHLRVCGRKKGKNNRKIVLMHRLLMRPESHEQIDHIDGNGLNNQRSNLRICNSSGNNMNRSKTTGKSKYKGIELDRWNGWVSRIGLNGKLIYLGRFKTDIEAARAYDFAALKYFGQFAKLNFSE